MRRSKRRCMSAVGTQKQAKSGGRMALETGWIDSILSFMTESTLKSTSKRSAAFVRRSAAVAKAAEQRHAEEATEIIHFIRSRSEDIAGAFWDIGHELAKLTEPKLYESVGCTSFEMLCSEKLGLSLTSARKLVAIANAFPRDAAILL